MGKMFTFIKNHFDKVFPIFITIIISGIIGYFTGIISLKDDLNKMEKSLKNDIIVIDDKIDNKIENLNGRINKLEKDINILLTDINKSLLTSINLNINDIDSLKCTFEILKEFVLKKLK